MLERPSVEQHYTLFDQLPTPAWIIDTSGAVVRMNHSLQRLTGLSESTEPHSPLSIIHHDDQTAAEAALTDQSATPFEVRLRDQQGRYRYFRLERQILSIPPLQTRGWMVLCTDIHEQRLSHQRLKDLHTLVRELPASPGHRENVREHLSTITRAALATGALLYSPQHPELHLGFSGHPEWQQGLQHLASEMRLPSGHASYFCHSDLQGPHRPRHVDGPWRAIALLPLNVPDSPALLILAFDQDQSFTDSDRHFLELLATHLGTFLNRTVQPAGREHDERFRQLAESANDLISRHAPDGRYLYASPSFQSVLGYSPTEVLQCRTEDFVHPEDLSVLHEARTRFLRGEDNGLILLRFLRRDGSTVWLECNGLAVRDPLAGTIELQIVARDVTARVQAERALHEERSRLRVLISSLDEGVIAVTPDGEATITNDAAIRLHGYDGTSDLPGTNLWDYVNLVQFKTLDGQEIPLQEWPIMRIMHGETLHDLELLFSHRDGSAARVLSFNGRLVQDAQAQPIMAIMVMRDITSRIEAQRALREREAQLRALSDNLSHVVTYQLTEDANGTQRFLHISANVERIHGVPRDAIMRDATNLYRQILPEDRLAVAAAEERARQTRTPFTAEARFRISDGQVRWFQLTSTPRELASGQIVWDGVQVDVTASKQIELALRESEQRYRATVEQAAVGVARVASDGRFLEVNPALTRLTGYTREELLQFSIQDITHPLDAHPDEDNAFERLTEGTLASYTRETRYRHKQGQTIWVNVTASAVRDAEGRHLYHTVVVEDITERKRTEAALTASERRFRSLVQATSQVVWTTDPTGAYVTEQTEWAAFTGQNFDEYRDWGWLDAIHPDDREATARAWANAVRNSLPYFKECRVRRSDGTYSWFEVRAVPVRDDDGVIREWIGVETDINERKQVESALRQLNATLEARVEERTSRLQELHAELTAFATSISRDIEAPLRRIQGFSNLLERRLGQPALAATGLDDRSLEYLRFIQAESSRVGRLVDDLAQFARSGRQELRLDQVPLAQLIVQVRSDLETFTTGRAIEWSMSDLPTVRGDMMLLRQAFAALLHNAIKFTRHQPLARIEVGARSGETEITVWVRDNGVGFNPAEAHRLFKVFQRLHDEHYGGAGVGLANVRRIVTRHGGRVWAEGREDEGATFYLTFPS